MEDPNYIVDGGANVGLTSLFVFLRHPNARIIAIEPDPENFTVAAETLAPFADRCHLVNGGLWSEDTELAISRGTQHWATQTVKPTDGITPTIPVFHLETLLERHCFPRIDFLKIDIEGAELQMFRDGDTSFLSKTAFCAIECHGDCCTEAFQNAISNHNFKTIESGELIIASRISQSVD